jgi:5-aminolevulinate synthase
MSNLQTIARRCPIMGKALSVQSARTMNAAFAGAYGGTRAYHSKTSRAKLHTSTPKEAQAVDVEKLRNKQGIRHIISFPRIDDDATQESPF